jgi:hypothetical protein
MPIHGHPIPRPPGRGKALWVVCWKPTLNTFAIIFEGGIVSIAVHLTDAMTATPEIEHSRQDASAHRFGTCLRNGTGFA